MVFFQHKRTGRKMHEPRVLDFNALPNDSSFSSRSLLIELPKSLEARLTPLPLTLERIQCAVMFTGQAVKQSEAWRAAAFLRAALAEYCSIEEMQKADRPKVSSFKISESTNPLLHLLQLMRHLNVHVRTTRTKSHSIELQLLEHTSDMDVYVVTNLLATELAALQNGANYVFADIEQSVTWFMEKQMHWGAGDLIRVGTEVLANEICNHYSL